MAPARHLLVMARTKVAIKVFPDLWFDTIGALMKLPALFFAILCVLSPIAYGQDWKPVYEKDGIAVAKKVLPDSSLMPFRGEGIVDVHISKLVGVIKTAGLGPDWVDLQVESKELHRDSDEAAIIYNKYDLSWPVSDRDYLMQQRTTYDADNKVVTVTYESIEDPRWPPDDCCVRAVAVRTYWKFEYVSATQTKIEVEVYTDPKGALPAWLVNMIQRGWPYNSITGISARAKKTDVTAHPRCTDW